MAIPRFLSFPFALALLLGSSSSFAESARVSKAYAEPTGSTSILHSHNDFAQSRPLDLALENGYRSVEVDVTDRWGEVRVTHLGFFTDGSLKEMYLDRLQKLVDEKGSVYGDGKRFYLWIELRPFVTSEGIVAMLRDLLPRYPMLTRYSEDGRDVVPGPVEAILMNCPPFLEKYFEGSAPKPACRGIRRVPNKGEKPARFARWSYMRWGSEFAWDGTGKIPEEEKSHLISLQNRAHAAGLRTRFWEVPDQESLWKQAKTLPFDLLGTDHLAATMATVRASEMPSDPQLASKSEPKEAATKKPN